MTEKLSERLKSRESCTIRKSCALPDYHEYRFSPGEAVFWIAAGESLAALLAYLFYRSFWAALILSPLVIPFYRVMRRKKSARCRRELEQQFKDALQAVTSGLQAGYSVENAIRAACSDMEQMYGADGMMTRELSCMVQGLRNSRTPEELMENLAMRSGSEDMMEFGEIFSIAKRTGGSLTEILKSCADTICDKLDTKKEIVTVMSAKRLEGRIMNVIPCGIILYIDISSPGFFQCLYHNAAGIAVMTICLAVYLFAVFLSERMMSVEV